jgi:hypothetical protein
LNLLIYQFYDEFEDLTENRQVEGLKALFAEIERDPQQYEDIILELSDLAIEAEISENEDHLENVRNLFDAIYDDLESPLIYDILEITSDAEADDYFGTEGLDI